MYQGGKRKQEGSVGRGGGDVNFGREGNSGPEGAEGGICWSKSQLTLPTESFRNSDVPQSGFPQLLTPSHHSC